MARAKRRSHGELVGQVLSLGARGPPVCGERVLSELGGLQGLTRACPASLSRLGLSPSQRAALLAAVEIACRLAWSAVPKRDPLEPSPACLARYIALRYAGTGQEAMGAVFLTARGDVLGEKLIFRGTLHRCAVEPGPVLKAALRCGAAGLILWHTHPSGDPTPSREDISFTGRMARSCELLGIRFLDHLVVAFGGAWLSLRERGREPSPFFS